MAPLQYLSLRKVLLLYFVFVLFSSILLCACSETHNHESKLSIGGRKRMLEIDDIDDDEDSIPKKKTTATLSTKNKLTTKPTSLSTKNQTKLVKPNNLSSKNQTKVSKSSDSFKEKSNLLAKSELKKLNSTSKASNSTKTSSSSLSKKSSDLLKVSSSKNKTTKATTSSSKETDTLSKKKVNYELEDSEKPKKKEKTEKESQSIKKKQSLADEDSDKPKKKKNSAENDSEKPKKKQKVIVKEEEEAEKPKKKQSNTDKESSKKTQSTEKKISKETKPPQKKTQSRPSWIDQDDDDDIVSEFRDLPIKFQQTLIPDLERISKTSQVYLNQASKEITRNVKPYVGNKYASTIASFVSFAFILIPFILVSLVFNRIKAYFSIQKIVIFIQVYLAIYFSILCFTSLVTGLEPLKFFYATSRSTYVCLQVLQTLGYVLYLLLLLMYLILVFSTDSGMGSKVVGLAQTFVGFAVGLHYYVAVFHRVVLHQPPKTNWKIHGIYALCFFLICMLSRAERRKKMYLEEGGEEGKKS